jgi:hypothetical protein
MAPGAIEAIDGDTIRAHGVVFRLHERRRVFVHPRVAMSGKLATKLRRLRSGLFIEGAVAFAAPKNRDPAVHSVSFEFFGD